MMTKPTKAELALARLFELYPDIFRKHQPPPLKVGIHEDLITKIAALGRPFTKRSIKGALQTYTLRPGYQRALKAGRDRVDLDGAAAGVVSEVEAAAAQLKVARLLEQRKAPPKTAKPKPSPKVKANDTDKAAAVNPTPKGRRVRQQDKAAGVAVVVKKKRRLS